MLGRWSCEGRNVGAWGSLASETKSRCERDRREREGWSHDLGSNTIGMEDKTKHTGHNNKIISSPSSKCFPTARPAACKGLLLCMGSLMSLDMLHTPNMRGQCKPICKIEEADGASFSLH